MLMRADGKYSPGYISVMVSTVERFADYLGNPIALTRPPGRTNTVPITRTEAEIAIIVHTTKNIREKAMLTTLAYSGIRNNEFCHLLIRDVDVPNGVLRVEECKFNKQRIVAVTGECLGVLEEYLAWRKTQLAAKGKVLMPDDLLFVTHRHGLPLESQDIRKTVHVAAKRAGIKRRVWPHLFRHSLATNMVNRNAHMLTIRDQLGHVYVQSTMVYVHRSKHAHTNDYRQHAPSYL